MRNTATSLLLLIAGLPILVWPGLFPQDTDSKVIVVRGLAFLVCFIVTILLLFFKEERENLITSLNRLIRNPIFISVSVSMILLGISTIFAFDPKVAFLGEPTRGEGFITLFSFYMLFVFMIMLFEKKHWRIFFLISSFTTLVLFVAEVVQKTGGEIRPSSLVGNPIFLAMYYLFSIFLAVFLWQWGREKKNIFLKILAISTVISALVGMLMAETRGVFLGIFIAVSICSLVAIFTKKQVLLGTFKIRTIGIFVCGFLIVFSIIFIPTRHAQFWKSVPGINRIAGTTLADGSARSRLELIKISLNTFANDTSPKKVLLGWGWDNYIFMWNAHYNPKVFFYDSALADRAHNKLIDMLIMTGILGLLSYIMIWFFFIKKIIYIISRNTLLGFSLLFLAISYFVSLLSAFDSFATYPVFYTLLAFSMTYSYE